MTEVKEGMVIDITPNRDAYIAYTAVYMTFFARLYKVETV